MKKHFSSRYIWSEELMELITPKNLKKLNRVSKSK